MASFSAGTTFTDGVANDVTAAKLAALVNAATPTSGLIQDRTAETTIAADDTLLFGDFSDSSNLKRMTVANFTGTLPTATITTLNSTTGTIATLNSTTGTIATGVIPNLTSSTATFGTTTSTAATITTGTIATLNSTTGTIATLNSTTGTIATLNSTTPTFLGAITASTNTINVGSGQVYKDATGNVGIGTLSPGVALDVNGTSRSSCLSLSGAGVTGGTSAFAAGTISADTNWGMYFRPPTGSSGVADYSFRSSADATLMVIGSGNVGIGTASPSAQLELSTDSAKKPSTNTWTIASDQRLKTNITNADNDRCYEIVKQVPLKRYSWKNEVYSQEQVRDRSKLGWIAQDVEAVFPKAVGTNRFAYNQVFEDVVTPELDSDGNAVLDENGVAKTKTEKRLVSEEVIEDCKDLNSDQIYAAMYGTIQKLIEKVETLEAKVAVLEAV